MKQLNAAVFATIFWAGATQAAAPSQSPAKNPSDVLVKFASAQAANQFSQQFFAGGAKVENLGGDNWVHVQMTSKQLQGLNLRTLAARADVLYVQPNYKLHMYEDFRLKDPAARARLAQKLRAGDAPPPFPGGGDGGGGAPGGGLPGGGGATVPADNPEFPSARNGGSGADPDFSHQWGMNDIGVKSAWQNGRGKDITVAVIDTGVDYTHEDLWDNLWHNPGETGMDSSGHDKASNKIDDDGNGYIDDVIGWDFASNDNKPFDLAVEPIQILMGGGNPGHGTHCSGNVGAVSENGKGVVGVAPDAKIMALRFLNEKGEGDTAAAVKAINYAVKMGARVLSNSWGSEGDDPADGAKNQALRDAITAAQNANVLFVAAAGNGHNGVGYDNDSDPKPGVPASYPIDNIVSVAAIDAKDALGAFSNWGAKTVHIAAPGVKVYSTTVGSHYSDMVIDLMGIQASWDGTSMACPHVAGAAAAYWSRHPNATYKEVKEALISTAKPVPALQGKLVSGGKLNVERLMAR